MGLIDLTCQGHSCISTRLITTRFNDRATPAYRPSCERLTVRTMRGLILLSLAYRLMGGSPIERGPDTVRGKSATNRASCVDGTRQTALALTICVRWQMWATRGCNLRFILKKASMRFVIFMNACIPLALRRYRPEGIIPSRSRSCGRSPKTNRLDSFTLMPIVIPVMITWGRSFITAHRFGEPLRKA